MINGEKGEKGVMRREKKDVNVNVLVFVAASEAGVSPPLRGAFSQASYHNNLCHALHPINSPSY